MNAGIFLSGWDTAILMAPVFGVLALWMFGLDERVATPRTRTTRRRFCQPDCNGEPGFSDPDGKPCRMERRLTPQRARLSATVEILPPDGSFRVRK